MKREFQVRFCERLRGRFPWPTRPFFHTKHGIIFARSLSVTRSYIVEIFIQSEIEKMDSNHLFHWNDNVFPAEGREFTWAEPQRHIIVKDRGLAIGHIGFGVFKVVGDEDENKEVIGVGGVVVRPEYHGQGIPGKMFEVLNATDTLNSASTVKTLFCPSRLTGYYKRHGYKEYCHSVKFIQNEGYTEASEFRFMVRGNFGLSCGLSIPSYPW